MADFTHSLAVVIGINAYGDGIPRLTTAVNDAARRSRCSLLCSMITPGQRSIRSNLEIRTFWGSPL